MMVESVSLFVSAGLDFGRFVFQQLLQRSGTRGGAMMIDQINRPFESGLSGLLHP
jgi:hypothetical protein